MLDQKDKLSDIDIRDAFFDELYEIAREDKEVLFLTADMGALSLEKFKRDLPRQYINVGIAEQNMISVAAGLTLGGKKVFVYAIAPFITQRCYEQIKIDLACMRLSVTIIGAGAGIVYNSDGFTHHAIQDIAIMRALPGMTILNPADSVTAAAVVRIARNSNGPVYVRIDKGKLPLLYDKKNNFSEGMAVLKDGRDLMIIATGTMVHQAFKAADRLARHSIDAGIIDLYRIKPINEDLFLTAVKKARRIATLEEHSIIGGIGSAVSEILADRGMALPLKRIGIADEYCRSCGDREWMRKDYGLDIENICKILVNYK
ncbi:MAG: transketolase C-terminal domain-containing protein [Candidatus Omnitrophota bacterium]